MKGLQLIWDENGVDLGVSGGSLTVGDTQAQEEYLVLMSQKGEWKEHPMVGVGIGDMVNDEDLRYWKREIMEGLQRVGIKIKGVSLKNGQLEIKH
ncbi:MAG: hypothetical protein IJ684_03010 [Bacteroidales bacterium]|nr:hypothetical protein [Bacteroidales bacterium]